MRAASGQRRLALGIALEELETTCHGPRHARRLDRLAARDEEGQPTIAFLITWHAVGALEHGFLDAAVRRDLDRVPDGQAVGRDVVMRLVDAPVDGQLRPRWSPSLPA